jgi:hypothetical protein
METSKTNREFGYIPENYASWGKQIIDLVNTEQEEGLLKNETLKRFLVSSKEEVINYRKFYEKKLFSSVFIGRSDSYDVKKEMNDFFAAMTVECMKKNNLSFQKAYEWICDWLNKIL